MTGIPSPEQSQPKLDKEQYLARLPDIDQSNLRSLIQIFEEVCQETQRGMSLVAVGGTISKPMPRHDIDLLIIFQKLPSDLDSRQYSNYFEFYKVRFKTLEDFIRGAVTKDSKFQVTDIIYPALDEEYQSPSILKHGGSMTLINQDGGMPLEFIHMTDLGSPQEVMANEKRPFVILTQTG